MHPFVLLLGIRKITVQEKQSTLPFVDLRQRHKGQKLVE